MAQPAGGARRTQLSDDAAAFVRNQIMSGEIRAGDSVRVEAVSSALEISTTPAREALQALRVEGFLELLPRRGFVVAPLGPSDVRDLFAAYSLIAGELAARAAGLRSDEQLARLDMLHQEMLAAATRGDAAELEDRNHAFHRQLNLIADAPKIQWVIGLMSRYIPRLSYAAIAGWPQATTEDHSAILEAIRAHDASAARTAMAAHIAHSGELLAQRFEAIDAERAQAHADTPTRVAG